MSKLTDAYQLGEDAAYAKYAATRGVREIRKAVQSGDVARADRLAKTPGVLSAGNRMGSQIKHLGAGNEGLATLVAHPQHGVSVRKMYDPTGAVYSPEVIAHKAAIGSVPGAAKHYGATTTAQGTPVHFNEFVQGQSLNPATMTPEQRAAHQRAMTQTSRALRKKGFVGQDIRAPNMMMTPSGEAKVIDFMPIPTAQSETHKNRQATRHALRDAGKPYAGRNKIEVRDSGYDLFGQSPPPGYDPSVSAGRTNAEHNRFTRYMLTGDKLPATQPGQLFKDKTAPIQNLPSQAMTSSPTAAPTQTSGPPASSLFSAVPSVAPAAPAAPNPMLSPTTLGRRNAQR